MRTPCRTPGKVSSSRACLFILGDFAEKIFFSLLTSPFSGVVSPHFLLFPQDIVVHGLFSGDLKNFSLRGAGT